MTLTPGERDAVYRRNFPLFLADFVLFTVAMNLISSTTVIPDYIRNLTDSEILIAFSGQMFEIGWLMPQLLVARSLLRVERKKWWFVIPNIPVRTTMFIYAIIIVVAGPSHPTLLLGAFLLMYGIAAVGDGVVGVPWIDLAGSSLDDRRRARLFGMGNALVGVLVLVAVAPVVRLILSDSGPDYPDNYALLFFLAGVIFLITVPPMAFVRELPGGKPREAIPPMREYLPELAEVLRNDRPFRTMVFARVLAALFTLAGPFYIGFATERLNMSNDVAVSNLLLMQTIGGVSGALAYSWLGERRSLLFIRLAMVVGVAQPALALLASALGPAPLYLAFLAAGVVGGSLGVSLINWMIVYATDDQRPIYSGLFNTMSAVGLMAAPLIGGLLVEYVSYEMAFATALVIMLCALIVMLRYGQDPHAAAAAQAAAAQTATQQAEQTP